MDATAGVCVTNRLVRCSAEHGLVPDKRLSRSRIRSGSPGVRATALRPYYYRARYYHPTLQRFISEDPIPRVGYGHLYAYVDNSPLRFTDPFGLDKCQATTAKPSYPPGTEWLGYYVDFVEKPLSRALIVTGAITSGAVVATAGLVASGAVVAAAPATYGTSLILLPGSLLVVAGGEYLIAFGTDAAINEINGLFATNIPGPHDVNPGLFPRMPPIVNRGCR